jgi:signal transduction histidine kinase
VSRRPTRRAGAAARKGTTRAAARGAGTAAERERLLRRQLALARADNRALRKSVAALMDRVERAVDDQGSAFSWFQAAANLEETVRQRTEQYEELNRRLTRELESRREIELALKQAKQQADLANAGKTRFLAAASHDLRQPLNSALLFLESMDDATLGEADRALLQKAKVALASLNNLLGTLLDVARLDSGAIEPRHADFPIAEVLDRIVPEFEGVARAAGLSLEFVPSRVQVRTDRYLLETVLRNFVSNAIRYTPRGRVLVGCRRRREGLLVCVHDTGVGIGRQHLDKIFEAYFQVPGDVRARDAGIGLGLSIVDRIARLLSLERLVRSEVGRGSMFAVLVPYGRAPARGRARAQREAPPPRRRPLTVVVIDDNQDVLGGMRAILERWGHRPVTATNATDAVVQLITADVPPDLIISDYHLGGGAKGDTAIEEVRREFDRPPPAAVMTSDPSPELRDRLVARGLNVLQKPLNLAKLRATLDRLGS